MLGALKKQCGLTHKIARSLHTEPTHGADKPHTESLHTEPT